MQNIIETKKMLYVRAQFKQIIVFIDRHCSVVFLFYFFI